MEGWCRYDASNASLGGVGVGRMHDIASLRCNAVCMGGEVLYGRVGDGPK